MSPIERQRRFLGRIPIEKWQSAKPGQVLYKHHRENFGDDPFVVREISVVDDETIGIKYDQLGAPADLAEGQSKTIWFSRSAIVQGEEINKNNNLPMRTNNPLIEQKVRWRP